MEIGGISSICEYYYLIAIERCPVKNRLLYNIKEELQELYEKHALDGFGLYMYVFN
jgi:hypothetical protein